MAMFRGISAHSSTNFDKYYNLLVLIHPPLTYQYEQLYTTKFSEFNIRDTRMSTRAAQYSSTNQLILSLVQHIATAGVNIYYHGYRCVQYCCTGTCGTSMLLQSNNMSNIIPLLRSTLLLVRREVEGLIHKDLYLVRLRKLPDKCRATPYRRHTCLTFVF